MHDNCTYIMLKISSGLFTEILILESPKSSWHFILLYYYFIILNSTSGNLPCPSGIAQTHCCSDNATRLFVQYFPIYNNENLPININFSQSSCNKLPITKLDLKISQSGKILPNHVTLFARGPRSPVLFSLKST